MGVCLLSINAVPLVNLPQGEDLQRIDSEQPSYVFGYQGNDDLHISESMLSQYVGWGKCNYLKSIVLYVWQVWLFTFLDCGS